ncbi:GNAT family N-acetyltransferase [uncultured Sphingorhabdus sp.]|uniref:GNAT family N-acetyltransferase n=1 Tax=uncultured Sphingorhabdus sp. TaxID=1686106 RepID=UPI002611AD2F|nr:GNAT family N-acetyltransferase [uncultured Sphingorhabdus sp.]
MEASGVQIYPMHRTQIAETGERSVAPAVASFVSAREFASVPRQVAEWHGLAADCSEPNAFNEHWYLTIALAALDSQGEVELAIVRSNGRLIGLMPRFLSTSYAGLPLRSVQNWLNHNAFLGTPLVAKGFEQLFWQALLSELDRQPNGALFCHLTGMAVDGPVASALEAECHATGRQVALFHREERALLERGLSPEAYLEATMRGKKRKELRRQQNRLAELGQLEFQRSDGREGLDGWIEEFLALERRGWKGANGSALDCADSTRSLFRGALHGAASKGKLELLALRLDGRAIAMLVNFLTPPGAFSFKTAFDEDYSRFSPGVLLQIHNLALLERDGIEWCDSCAAQDHPMIDSIWSGRRAIGRYSVSIGGPLRRAAFAALLFAEKAKGRLRQINAGKSKEANGKSS